MNAHKKVLFTAHVDSHILAFHIPYLKYFKSQGYEVHVASCGDSAIPHIDVKYDIPIERSPIKINNLRSIRQLKKIIDRENYDIIHTHTPMGSVVTRLASMSARKRGTRVLYTAHGFHFYDGAPLINWLIYYPIEKAMSHTTDDLITINTEDFERAKTKFKTNVHYIPGVGIDPKKLDIKMTKADKTKLRKTLGLKDSDFVIIYPAELNKNKNQKMLISVMESLVLKYPNIHLLLPGKDSMKGFHKQIIKVKGLEGNIHLLGYRKDIPELLKISDIAVSTSLREGLPVNIMEAMYLGLPVVATDCRGNRDLIVNNSSGYIVPQFDDRTFTERISGLYTDKKLRDLLGRNARKTSKKYVIDDILKLTHSIYRII